ncbi:VapE domain-containing protein [Variovorax fucosicus]|uniref:VapE domain-containing protein n=1 Tax=Variovorax fucosicus TaxID=3053517 RepID=UPI002574BA47|nr:VapE domain-containing protein [Variovorax sp. J22G47]MDM0057343.1 VapE family protein [Variovorax sp. J22G47]
MSTVFSIENSAVKWMLEDLAKSGLKPEDMGASASIGEGRAPWPDVQIIDDGEKDTQNMAVWVSMHYAFPYWNPDGTHLENVMVRKPRFKAGTPHEISAKKYVRPSKRAVGVLATIPYMHPGRVDGTHAAILDIHEGEKKTACAVVKGGQCAIGIGGCNSWGDPENKGQIHPWIVGEVARIQAACPDQRVKVRLWADADYKTNQNVAHGYSGLASALAVLDVDVVIMDMSNLRPGAKFDDLVAEVGYAAVMAGAIEQSTLTLPENPETLVRKYQLIPQTVGKRGEERQVPQAIDINFDRLLELHPEFHGRLWLDRDRRRAMFGDSELVENIGDNDMLHFFQKQLGFNGPGRTITSTAMRAAIASRIARDQRSPFNDRARAAADRLRDAGPDAMQAADEALNAWTLRYLRAPDTPWNRRWGRKFLMAVVGRALRPGCSMRTAFCLAGPQGIGKTFFMNSIVGQSNVSLVSKANSGGKDLAMTYGSCLVAVHDEMAAMTGSAIEHVKSDISTAVDNIRLPYGRMNVDMPRRCVFYVPVDKPDFLLEDAAGMTRFAVLDLLKVDFKGGKFDFAGMEAAADDLLGAALIAVESGERFDEVDGAAESAAAHVKTDLNMDQIRDVIEGPHGAALLTSGDYKGRVITGLKLTALANLMPPGYKANGGGAQVLTGPLRKLGFEHEDRNKNPLNVRGLWFMDKEKFDAQFVVKGMKYD